MSILIKKLKYDSIIYVNNKSIQLPILNHKLTGIINAVDIRMTQGSNSFKGFEQITPIKTYIMGK